MINVQVIFRVFDRNAYEEFEFSESPMVYNVKRRVKLITGSEKGHDENTAIFKEIIIDNGSRMIIYKWVLTKWNCSTGKMRYRQLRKEHNDQGVLMELIRTKQVI